MTNTSKNYNPDIYDTATGGNVIPDLVNNPTSYQEGLPKKKSCHYTCVNCTGIDDNFLKCTSCKFNRVLKILRGK